MQLFSNFACTSLAESQETKKCCFKIKQVVMHYSKYEEQHTVYLIANFYYESQSLRERAFNELETDHFIMRVHNSSLQ